MEGTCYVLCACVHTAHYSSFSFMQRERREREAIGIFVELYRGEADWQVGRADYQAHSKVISDGKEGGDNQM